MRQYLALCNENKFKCARVSTSLRVILCCFCIHQFNTFMYTSLVAEKSSLSLASANQNSFQVLIMNAAYI